MVNVGTVKVGKYTRQPRILWLCMYMQVWFTWVFSGLFWLFLAEQKYKSRKEHHKGDCDGVFQKRGNTHNRL